MRWAKRIIQAVVIAIAAGGGVVVPLSMAWGWDMCKDAPPPVSPVDGMAGVLTVRPAQIPDAAPDPFADQRIPIGDVYGFNWGWSNYDLGCGNDFLADPAAVATTMTANSTAGFMSASLALLDMMETLARETGVGWFGNVVVAVTQPLKGLLVEGITTNGVRIPGWTPLAVIMVGVVVTFYARRAKFAKTAKTVLIVMGCLALTYALLYLPGEMSKRADKVVVDVSTAAGSGLNSSLADGPNRSGAYRTWLTGWFGSADSQLAKEFGPRLMAATRYTWSDVQAMERDPNWRKKIDEAKATDFKQIAAEVKKRDPGAYERFKGRGGDRAGIALMGLFSVACMTLFGLIASVMILLGRVIMQALVIAAPIGAALGIVPGQGHVLRRMWDLFAAALLGVIKFSIAAGAMSIVLASLARLDPVTAPIWMLIATITALMLTKPGRTMKTLIPGADPNRHYAKEGLVSALHFASHAKDLIPTRKKRPSAATDDEEAAQQPAHVAALTKPAPALTTKKDTSPAHAPARPSASKQLPGPQTAHSRSASLQAGQARPTTSYTFPGVGQPALGTKPNQNSAHGAELRHTRAKGSLGSDKTIVAQSVNLVQPAIPRSASSTSPASAKALPPAPVSASSSEPRTYRRDGSGEPSAAARLPEPEMDADGRSKDVVLYVPRERKAVVPA